MLSVSWWSIAGDGFSSRLLTYLTHLVVSLCLRVLCVKRKDEELCHEGTKSRSITKGILFKLNLWVRWVINKCPKRTGFDGWYTETSWAWHKLIPRPLLLKREGEIWSWISICVGMIIKAGGNADEGIIIKKGCLAKTAFLLSDVSHLTFRAI